MFRLDNKVVLVTGGSKGIGLGMAEGLGKMGAKVVIASRGIDDLKKAGRQLADAGIDASIQKLDVTDKKSVQTCVDEVVQSHGRIDILINNAGMNIRKPLTDLEEADWERVINTNLKGVFLVGQAVSQKMIAQKYGRIINISSIFGDVGGSFQTSYAASKGGVNQMTKVWADELAKSGITVNAIAPGYIKTPMTEGWLEDTVRFQSIVDQTMMKRVGVLEDLNGPVVFLASEASGYVTGQTIYVDGGWTAK